MTDYSPTKSTLPSPPRLPSPRANIPSSQPREQTTENTSLHHPSLPPRLPRGSHLTHDLRCVAPSPTNSHDYLQPQCQATLVPSKPPSQRFKVTVTTSGSTQHKPTAMVCSAEVHALSVVPLLLSCQPLRRMRLASATLPLPLERVAQKGVRHPRQRFPLLSPSAAVVITRAAM